MAVRASDLTFLDFGDDRFPGGCPPHEARNFRDLPELVVELEDARIGLAAVDARMFQQMVVNA